MVFVSQTQIQSERSQNQSFTPLVYEFDRLPDVLGAFKRFSRLENVLLLDSSKSVDTANGRPLGRYSFLTAEPFEWMQFPVDSRQGLANIRSRVSQFSCPKIADLPPFQGGLAGLLSYDLNRSLEKIPAPSHCEFELPSLAVGLYDIVLAWDHETNRAFLISQGFPALENGPRHELAQRRINRFLKILESPIGNLPGTVEPIPREQLAPSFPVLGLDGLFSNYSQNKYIETVEKAIDYIHAGDVFQINLAQRLLFQANCLASQLYERLRRCNPSPFSGYFDLGSSQIVSASPERLIALRDGTVETRPIKGTRKRTRYPEVDLHAQRELKSSEKDRAENTMIVDLMRNDLSRVCRDDSVRVTQLCELEKYESVLHLVSAVQGQLRDECDAVDLLEAIFPGGSITGAPKIRAQEIIAELEQTARGAYCGSLGYISFDGSLDFNILIRTITASKGWWQIPVGGGIVSQSDPHREYEETWTKAAGMLRALTP